MAVKFPVTMQQVVKVNSAQSKVASNRTPFVECSVKCQGKQEGMENVKDLKWHSATLLHTEARCLDL